MSRKNRDVFSEAVVGVFMVVVIALLGYFTIVISGVDVVLGKSRASATIAFRDVGGLKERDNVIYRGMKVGTVEKIALGASNIVVTAAVDHDVVLRSGCRISVAALSLLGGNYLLLEEGDGRVLPLEQTVFRGEPPVDWMRDLGEIARTLSDLTARSDLRGIVTNIEETARNLNTIIARVARGEGTVGRLLSSDETMYADFKSTVASAKTAAENIDTIAARVAKGEGTVGRLLSTNDTVYIDLETTLSRAAEISDRLAAGQGTIGGLLSTNDTVYADLKGAVANIRQVTDRVKDGDGLFARLTNDKAIGDNASALLDNLRKVSDRLAKGEGTLGKLANEQELYDEVSSLIKDVRQIVDNYRDTTPVSTFGSLLMGGL